jgi:hypothetical protein
MSNNTAALIGMLLGFFIIWVYQKISWRKKATKPNANVEAVLIQQSTPSMWTDEEWNKYEEAHDEDMKEFRETPSETTPTEAPSVFVARVHSYREEV